MTTAATLACENLFYPSSVAVVGASQNLRSLGSRHLKVLKEFGYGGKLFAVNPRAETSFGIPGYRRLTDIPVPIDFCVIVVPAAAVAEVVAASVAKAVPVAQILTGGFGEAGPDGQRAEQALLQAAAGKTRLVGPNCMGVYSARGRLTFVATAATAEGTISIASQSGGLSLDMVLQAKARGLALSKVVSMGNCLDLGPDDFLQYFGADSETEVIGLYLEGLRDRQAFLPTLTEVARRKPVVILKGGRTGLGARSVASHTNVLAGEYAIWKAAAAQTGALLVETVDDFLATLSALQYHVPRPHGPGLALVGNGGGSTVLATDVLAECGLTLSPLQRRTRAALGEIPMPPGASVGNPTDTPLGALNTSGAASLGRLMQILLQDAEVHGLVVHFNFAAFLNYDNRHDLADGVAAALRSIGGSGKPVYVALRGTAEPAIEALRSTILDTTRKVGLPCFPSAHEAVRTLARVYTWSQRTRPHQSQSVPTVAPSGAVEARRLLQDMRQQGHQHLPQLAAFRLLALFDIPHPDMRLAQTASEAVAAAQAIGFPVVLKIDARDILHKTEAGGVRTELHTATAVAQAFDDIWRNALQHHPGVAINGVLVQAMSPPPLLEMICGVQRDAVFGPVLLVGLGGILVELLRDVAMRVIPVSADEVRRMWQELGGAALLQGYRGRPKADTVALEDLLCKVAALAASVPEILEMDLNPVMLLPQPAGLSVVDCRIILAEV